MPHDTPNAGPVPAGTCLSCAGEGWTKVRRPTSGTRRSPRALRCLICHGTGVLPERVEIRVRGAAREEIQAQYHEDTHVLVELGVSTTANGVEGTVAGLQELAYLIECDYDLETGFETVKSGLKREMLIAAGRISRAVGKRTRT